MSVTSNKSDFIDEIYVPQKSDVCPTPIVDFIDEVYVPKKKDKDLTNNSVVALNISNILKEK
jgi:hypothetical protein